MGDTLDYTEEEAQQEESTFKTPAAIARRQLVRETLDFQPDDNVLSIGCGPGFEPAEIAEDVGQNGHVHAIDQSEASRLTQLSPSKSTSILRILIQHLQSSLEFSDQEGERSSTILILIHSSGTPRIKSE